MRSATEHVSECIARAAEETDRIEIALLTRRDDDAVAEAATVDAARSLAGDVLTVKACFDVAGWTTHAGSAILASAPAAATDAPMVTALRNAGAILLAQTNMTEFAYGALGLNATYGTPTTPLLNDAPRVSGGSTSGGAVAVTLGVADISLGSDTSGSVRIPAAFCGVAGFKPSQGRYSTGGMIPLAPSFDAPGIIASTAAHCRRVDVAITGRADPGERAPNRTLASAHFVVPLGVIDAGSTDAVVVDAFERWIRQLSAAGARITEKRMPCLLDASEAAREGLVIAVEAFDWHRDLIGSAANLSRYDPRVGQRILLGATALARDYVAALRRIRTCAAQYDADLAGADAILTPAVAILPPRLADVQTMESYLALNTEVLRLTEFANRLDLPSVTVPANLAEREPFGLLLNGRRGDDACLLDLAVLAESCLAGNVGP